MLQVLQFIFSSFWHWLGAFLLVGAIGESIRGIFRSFRKGA